MTQMSQRCHFVGAGRVVGGSVWVGGLLSDAQLPASAGEQEEEQEEKEEHEEEEQVRRRRRRVIFR